MDKALVKFFKSRWEFVEEIEKKELTMASPLQKLHALAVTFQIAQKLKLVSSRDEDMDVADVRKRWVWLKGDTQNEERR
ncbi:MAG: hypothetical protein AABY27_04085 [Pseudomonadota bacterium]